MIDISLDLINSLVIVWFLLPLSFFLLVKHSDWVYKTFNIKQYQSKQRLHQHEVPRFGGIIIYVFLVPIAIIYLKNPLLTALLIAFIPLGLLSIKEDFHLHTRPSLRIMMMILSCFVFIFLMPGQFPRIDIPVIGEWISYMPVKLMFFTFSIMVIVNGNNLIDGINGNMVFTNLIQITVLACISFQLEDIEFFKLCLLIILFLLIFIPFNFPCGRIFMGDTGAYLFGFVISGMTIYFFGKYDEILSWNALLILFYPSIELLFSFARKRFVHRISPLSADAKHLHTIIFRYLKLRYGISNNSFVIVCLLPFTLLPMIFFEISFSLKYLLLTLLSASIFYVLMYVYFLRKIKENDYSQKISNP